MSGRKQHFFPRNLLRRFGRASKDTKVQVVLYTYERGIFIAAADGVAAERQFYSELDVDSHIRGPFRVQFYTMFGLQGPKMIALIG